jgi:spore germination protein
MYIHVVQPGDTIQTISDFYGVSVEKIILDNGLENPNDLVIGQSIVIAYPEITYTVQEGDTLLDIANHYNVTVIQLLANNPHLSERGYLLPGETLTISYHRIGTITTHGNTAPFINKATLKKTLPFLTYLSVLNYTAAEGGDIITYYDDTETIQLAKDYGVMPLMLLTTLSVQGEANIGVAFDLLLNEEYQNRQIENVLNILRTKGYYGVNISFEYISVSNLQQYEAYFTKISQRLQEEGYFVFLTITPNITSINNEVVFERIDYTHLDQLSQHIIFMNYEWATSVNPPSPISSIYNLNIFLDYVLQFISPEKVIIGCPTLGYDWELPYSAGLSSIYSLTLNRTINLARYVGATIQFDEKSQTPYFTYTILSNGDQIAHIVWFIDARSINSLLGLVAKYNLNGTGIWNITIYNAQLWTVINSQYEIEKLV